MRTTGPNQPGHLLLDVRDLPTDLNIPNAVVGVILVRATFVPSLRGISGVEKPRQQLLRGISGVEKPRQRR